MKSQQTCPVKERLFAYAIHALEPAEEPRMRTHLEQCQACRNVVAGYRRLEETLDEWKPAAPSPWFDARTRARVLSSVPTRSRSLLGSSFKRWVAIAAMVVVVAVAGVTVFHNRATHSQSPAKSVAMNAEVSAPSRTPNPAPSEAEAAVPQQSAEQELDLYENLHVLENYDMLANFDVISELPKPGSKVND